MEKWWSLSGNLCLGISVWESLAWPIALGEEGKLAEVFNSAGVLSKTIDSNEGRARFSSINEFARTEIQSWVLADSVNDTALDAVLRDSSARLSEYCSASGALDIPFKALIAMAEKYDCVALID